MRSITPLVGWVDDPIFETHDTGDHEENAERLVAIRRRIVESGVDRLLTPIQARPVTREEVQAVHAPELYSALEQYAARGGGWLTPDTVVSPGSFQAALMAAGGVCNAVDAVMAGQVQSAFALVRPPGHHATATRAMGFCLFNNVAIAAHRLFSRHRLERVLIVDFDVHHGNGTQDAFYDDPRVLYVSVHQYPFYPGTGRLDETGVWPGQGTTVNVPLPAYCGDDQYRAVADALLLPVARRFAPQFVLISAGYDAHWADPLAFMQLSLDGFTFLVEALQSLANELADGRITLCLEGGYNLEALSRCVLASFGVLLGRNLAVDDLPRPRYDRSVSPEIRHILEAARRVHRLK